MSTYCIIWRDIYGEIRTTTIYASNFAEAERSGLSIVKNNGGILIKIEFIN